MALSLSVSQFSRGNPVQLLVNFQLICNFDQSHFLCCSDFCQGVESHLSKEEINPG